ncbi:hypothetical protein [Neobacillus sp. PS3-40]|uniref:hypothetical protein n=1 Tax=Neobacillus sp. PS3-40 TaxID=3070679 RepID=UPI0027E13AA5|nr:hypothetical protein [Neobacillus sp. PS3-40]WML42699.1 hypothetical protein RCG20_12695 [Neobacillus sp. PS3-40]
MTNEYLTGRITVFFGCDTVSLIHKVHGRYSNMDLEEGDFIEVEDHGQYKATTVKDILKTLVEKTSNNHTEWNVGQSLYEGCKARVKLNDMATKIVEFNNKKYAIEQIFKAVENESFSLEEAKRTILKWETDIEE